MIVLVDYGMGNLLSVSKAFKHLGVEPLVTSDPGQISNAGKLVLPGVGNFGDGMHQLSSMGISRVVFDFIASGKPFLGICLGMQLLMESSEEAPGCKGLSVFQGTVKKLPAGKLKIPQIGWNQVKTVKPSSPFFSQIPPDSFFYFVHSFFVCPDNPDTVGATCDYSIQFPAAFAYGNVFATQFHPEKSQNNGLRLLKNFMDLPEA